MLDRYSTTAYDEETPRKLETMTFVMHAPNDYFKVKQSPYPPSNPQPRDYRSPWGRLATADPPGVVSLPQVRDEGHSPYPPSNPQPRDYRSPWGRLRSEMRDILHIHLQTLSRGTIDPPGLVSLPQYSMTKKNNSDHANKLNMNSLLAAMCVLTTFATPHPSLVPSTMVYHPQ
uniref:(California timema) hypothetical protein n=1 Tax=Timema californicum TaxID=61474 RepID=A0A7R9JA32_TIMCA|nr:unnamed protein product [Timema californicum]